MKFLLLIFLATTANAYWETREVSWFCPCKVCCGRYSKHGITASGKRPVEGITVAENFLPFGTRIYIFNRWYVVQDRMAFANRHRVDIYVRSHSQAKMNGIQKVKVWVDKPDRSDNLPKK